MAKKILLIGLIIISGLVSFSEVRADSFSDTDLQITAPTGEVNLPITIRWNAYSGAEEYRWRVIKIVQGNETINSNPVVSGTVSANTLSVAVPLTFSGAGDNELIPNQLYMFGVVAKKGLDVYYNTITAIPKLPPPALRLPADNANVSSQVQLEWNPTDAYQVTGKYQWVIGKEDVNWRARGPDPESSERGDYYIDKINNNNFSEVLHSGFTEVITPTVSVNLTPSHLYSWTVRSCKTEDAQTCGKFRTYPFRFRTTASLLVSLTANPSAGIGTLRDVNLTASVSGEATGPIDYYFYCDRRDEGTNITPTNIKSESLLQTSQSTGAICHYTQPDTYKAKVIVKRAGQLAQAQAVITVSPLPSPPALTPEEGEQVNPPNLTNPTDGREFRENETITFGWSPISDVTNPVYGLWVGVGDSTSYVNENISNNTIAIPANIISQNQEAGSTKTYSWTVRLVNSADENWSDWNENSRSIEIEIRKAAVAPPPGTTPPGTTPPGTTPPGTTPPGTTPPGTTPPGTTPPGPSAGGITISNPLKFNTFDDLVNWLIKFAFYIALAVAPLMIIVAGFYYVTSAGDPGRLKTAQTIILYTAIGLGVILLARGLIAIIKAVLGG